MFSLITLVSPIGEKDNKSEKYLIYEYFHYKFPFKRTVKRVKRVKIQDKQILQEAEEAIRTCFKRISFIKIKDIISEFQQDKVQADLWVKLEAPENYPDISVEVKTRGEPRFIRDAVNQQLRYLEYVPNAYGIIIAPYISERSAEICREAGIGYIDLSGNCFIEFEQVHIAKESKPNTRLEKKVLKSLYYPKAERVLRVLLNSPGKTWKMETLSKEADVSLGMSSKVKKRLEAMEWLESSGSGFRLLNWEELLKEWSENYRYSKNTNLDFYSLKNETYIEKQLSEYCNDNNIKYAFTLFSGASKVAPYTRYKRVNVYLQENIEAIKELLSLKKVSSGPNVTISIPYDSGVFYNSKEYKGISVVSNIQLYLDLINFKERGEEAAEFLFDKIIKTLWSQNQISELKK
jgi:hypothetical protein